VFEYLRRLAALLRNGPSPFDSLPPDPYAHVGAPRRRNPGGRSSSIAVEEPEPRRDVTAIAEAARRGDRSE
jgi:hypothetical protein